MPVLVAGVLGGLLLVAGELSTIASVEVAGGSCEVVHDTDPALADRCVLSGWERHGGAFLLLGLVAVALAWPAGPGRSRPAAGALAAIGALVLAFALLSDLPAASETGAIGSALQDASASAGAGLWLQVTGGVLLVLTGAASSLRPGGTSPR